jgi:Rap1a immunity proteins
MEWAGCREYIVGVRDMLKFNGDGPVREGHLPVVTSICDLPKDLPSEAFVQTFVNWAQRKPEEWAHHRLLGVMSSLMEKWHCKLE